ncbi:cyclin-like protein [Pavlovales sp. CCMP2436]|nr:cyclin-like protein [Pavlovales sp. CCMP2436]
MCRSRSIWRALLIDWMSEVCMEYRLMRSTYHLGVTLADKMIASSPEMPKKILQLADATALFMAAKIEGMSVDRASSFASTTGGTCSAADILSYELRLMCMLDWVVADELTPACWAALFTHHALAKVELAVAEAKWAQREGGRDACSRVRTANLTVAVAAEPALAHSCAAGANEPPAAAAADANAADGARGGG